MKGGSGCKPLLRRAISELSGSYFSYHVMSQPGSSCISCTICLTATVAKGANTRDTRK